MLITNHWSGSGPVRLRAYHIEIARTGEIGSLYSHDLRAAWQDPTMPMRAVDFALLHDKFVVWKNDTLTTINDYGTWDENSDPRDHSANVEIASMCMPGGATDFAGTEPFTIGHAWMHAYICAVVAKLKGIDLLGAFPTSVEPGTLQNGPIDVCGTHGSRAIQTIDFGVPNGNASSQALSDEFGYFFGSGDPDSRADLFCLDPAWYTGTVTKDMAIAAAAEIRQHAHIIKGSSWFTDMWGLDGPETP